VHQVCILPNADVSRVACWMNLQGLLAADLHAAAHTHFTVTNVKGLKDRKYENN
jgi:hypothetical protein